MPSSPAWASILVEIERGEFEFSIAREDIHMNIEARLIEKIGPVGGKRCTPAARATTRWPSTCASTCATRSSMPSARRLTALRRPCSTRRRSNLDVIMPGYTHLQTAQPILFAHHLLAYVEMFARDAGRLDDCAPRLNVLPLGAGALAGTTFPIDREWVAQQLGFDGVTRTASTRFPTATSPSSSALRRSDR